MAINFQIPKAKQRNTAQTLAKGFGLPIVKRAFLNVDEITSDTPDGVSKFGTPVYGTIFIEAPVFFNYVYDTNLKTYTQVEVFSPENDVIGDKRGCFIEGAIIEVNQNRNIVTTTIAGMDGSVKEFINNGDYSVTIRGFFSSNDADVYPAVDVRTLSAYLKAPVSLKITNLFLNDYFGITDIVPVSYSFHQQEGIRNVQYFTIECLSDLPYEIQETIANA